MKKNFILLKINIIFILIICIQILLNLNCEYAASEDIYDVILFWGQSNMVGSFKGVIEGQKPDDRYNNKDENSIKDFSKKTGIDIEILRNTEAIGWTKTFQEKNTVYEYKYIQNDIIELNENTKRLGERLKYNLDTTKLEVPTDPLISSIYPSQGTNMIPQFCKTYYEKTGHKVIAVLAANGGEKIENFLPHSDADYGDTNNQMIYEAMVEKYKSAINYMNKKGYKIENKLYVVFQGESNASKLTTKDEYKRLFLKVHNNLKNDLGIMKGAIVETSYTIGMNDKYDGVKKIFLAQEELIKENDDIILGSSYSYDRYVPDEATYNSNAYKNDIFIDSSGKKLPYDTAFEYASYSVCYPNNTIHFTSAALAQIGKETAESFSKIIDVKILKNPSKINYIKETEQLDLNNGVIQVTYNNGSVENISMTDKRIKIEGFNNKIIGKNEITLNFFDNILKFKINIIPKGKELEHGNTLIADFDIGTKVSDIINNKSLLDYTVKVFDENNKDISNEENRLIGTGCIIKIYDKQEKNNLIKSYNTVIFGDVNGDSSINAIDALIIVKNKLGMEKFKNEACNEAGKVSVISRETNSVPSSKDALCVVKYKLDSKQYPISQQMFYDV